MSTLLLRLAAPLQSWGGESKFDRRMTERYPTKSGVTGLLAAALGLSRNAPLAWQGFDLCALRMGVRIDRQGELLRDYQTVKSKKSAYVTERYYLADAVFLVGVEGDDALLTELDQALSHPVYPLFLGRRSCPPEGRVSLGIREGLSLEDALRLETPLADSGHLVPMLTESQDLNETAIFVRDLPVSFDPAHRQYRKRRLREAFVTLPNAEPATEHDPLAELEV